MPATLHSTTCLTDFQKSVLAGGVTVWVDTCAKLDFFSIVTYQDIAFLIFLTYVDELGPVFFPYHSFYY